MTSSGPATVASLPDRKSNELVLKSFDSRIRTRRLYKIDRAGKLYVPKPIQEIFKGYRFFLIIENGKLVYDPVKVDEDFEDEEEVGEG